MAVIQVENLSKSFTISHEQKKPYHSLREVVTERVKTIFSSNNKNKVSATSEEFWALNDVNFEIQQGDRVGIIGRNGAGKSTLLKILSRITEPTRGRVTIEGRVASLLEVGTGFHPELTGRENIFLNGAILGMSRAEIRSKFDEIVAFAEIEKFLDTPVKRYSSGMYVRLAFAVAAHLEPEILIVDEVLAVGDAQFQKKCLGKMEDVSKNDGRTVLFVSHNMGAISEICNKGVLLNSGNVEAKGSIQEIINIYSKAGESNVASFNKYIERVSFTQDNDELIIDVKYNSEKDIDIPHFGFVIKNNLGMPVVGSNPTIEGIKNKSATYSKKGEIRIRMEQPRLLDGMYSASVWFGSSFENFLIAPDCLSFFIAGMSKIKQLDATNVGNAAPKCNWEFL